MDGEAPTAEVLLSYEAPDLVDACDPAAPPYEVTPEAPAKPSRRPLGLLAVTGACFLFVCALIPSSWTLLTFGRDGSFVVFEVSTAEWVRSPVAHGWLVLRGDKLAEEDFGLDVAPAHQALLPDTPSETTLFGRTITLGSR